jgi:hypothetical protein
MMGISIQDLLSGDIVKPRVAPQDDSRQALGSMLAFLSQGQNQQAAPIPQQPNYAEIYRVTPQERAAKRAAEQHAGAVEQMKTLIGDPGSPGNGIPTPYRNAQLPTKGSGLLGGGSLQEFAAKLATSQDPAYASAGLDMIAAKPTPPHYITMGVPGQPGYETNARVDGNTVTAIGVPRKSYSGVTVNTGENGIQHIMTDKEKTDRGLNKNNVYGVDSKGNIQTIEKDNAPTEAQTKVGTHYAGLAEASDSMFNVLENYSLDPTSSLENVQDFAGNMLTNTNIPVVKQFGKLISSDQQQLLGQAQQAGKVHVIHALTGGGYSAQEAEDKADAYIPQWGDSNALQAAKKRGLAIIRESLRTGAFDPESLRKTTEELVSLKEKPQGGRTAQRVIIQTRRVPPTKEYPKGRVMHLYSDSKDPEYADE